MINNPNPFSIDQHSRVPLYELIEQNFRQIITSGVLKTGEMVPSEAELCEYYKVSRLTVRRAMDELARQGWIIRRQGVGTFIKNPKNAQITPSRLSFTEQMKAIGRVPSSRLISEKVIPATAEISRNLDVQENEPVIEVIRIRMADNEPILLETTYLSKQRFPDFEEALELEHGSLYDQLQSHYGVTIATMNQTLEAIMLTEKEAAFLGIQAGVPSLLSEVVAFDLDGKTVEYSWSISSGNKSKFYFSFHRKEEKV
ncbi:MAG: GntR family transcriptional regulator [Anaerolineaceae bacterium]|jgi:GntR family transcriptional regulator|nr:GntR family transcriptional regulator [Anaerolineaceae bacterium]